MSMKEEAYLTESNKKIKPFGKQDLDSPMFDKSVSESNPGLSPNVINKFDPLTYFDIDMKEEDQNNDSFSSDSKQQVALKTTPNLH